ncbi:MAG TPA: hypothetical protein VF020_20970, partial [Chthoniobacterales bacterium]
MIRRGFCVRCTHHPRHIYVVLNDPQSDGRILFVNFTSFDQDRDQGEEVFTAQDYRLLVHESVIAFWGTYPNVTAGKLARLVQSGDFVPLPDLPEATLQRIVATAKKSRHLSQTQKSL